MSARARHKRDVGRATLLAVLSALAVYLLVTLLSLGVSRAANWPKCATRRWRD